MAVNLSNNLNSAFLSGYQGFQTASNNITQAAVSIANSSAQPRDTTQLLGDVATQQLGLTGDLIRGIGSDNLTDNLVSLAVNQRNAEANLKVVGTASETIGRIIDELA
ncbi:hypothetical protein [Bowmanella sp. JS7-9]|uniref:Uncharacterized protein n=1 Tax=Pseudobowmanella zhangzhouensis TaxID=1537679 RepID=A0ABW1XED4_9ALTE|nr:hypothetical protein [Bowmanella sp. JS7-9]TBX20922.1 hypothetical protein TK45_14265 [Bowmanella sp. JS7-9]